MKKVSILFDRKLQQLLANDKEFKGLPVFRYALTIVNFITELSATGIVPKPLFPMLNCDFNIPETIRLTDSELALFVEAYKASGRIEAQIYPGTVDVCLGVLISFYPKGKGDLPLLIISAGADSMAVRRFSVVEPTNVELRKLYEEGKRERQKRNAKEADKRALARIGP